MCMHIWCLILIKIKYVGYELKKLVLSSFCTNMCFEIPPTKTLNIFMLSIMLMHRTLMFLMAKIFYTLK